MRALPWRLGWCLIGVWWEWWWELLELLVIRVRQFVAAACCCFWVWEVTVVAGECRGFLVRQNLLRAMEGQLRSVEAE